MKSPVLVSSIDGVGTKLLVAIQAKKLETVGEDLVNHCVNDILVCGASPLFFLDYFACGKLRPESAAEIVGGFARACKDNRCALIGGETAEMPGLYREEDFDLAGAIVGVVDRKNILDGRRVRRGDVVLGLRSSGLHTNGYSLARSVLLERFTLDEQMDELGSTLGEALLAVHRPYLKVVEPLFRRFRLHALAHITGGGIVGNTSRVLPGGRKLAIDWQSWERPALFRMIQKLGDVPEDDMRRTFNLGIGLVVIVAQNDADAVSALLRRRGEDPVALGDIR
jgi:phosphoribosylformylglycinamidine cyclo-ligase